MHCANSHLLCQVSPLRLLSRLHPEVSHVPGGPSGDGIGANLHLQADIATAHGLNVLGDGIAEDLGGAYMEGKGNIFYW